MTGACGWTAASIIDALREAGHDVVGLDLPGVVPQHEVPLAELHCVDVAELEELLPLADSSDAVVHLAVAVGPTDYESPERPFRTNVRGSYAVFEAARRAGVERVVLMGSAPVQVAPKKARIDARKAQPSSPGSDFLYDLTKCLQESIARQFCETHGMTAITLRAGHIVDGRAHRDPNGTPLSELRYCRGGWICRYDLARAVVAALGWKGRGYEAFYIIGARQARETFDVERAEAMLGITLDTNFSEYEAS